MVAASLFSQSLQLLLFDWNWGWYFRLPLSQFGSVATGVQLLGLVFTGQHIQHFWDQRQKYQNEKMELFQLHEGPPIVKDALYSDFQLTVICVSELITNKRSRYFASFACLKIFRKSVLQQPSFETAFFVVEIPNMWKVNQSK